MNIEIFVSPEGQVVLTCDGKFEKEIDQVVLDGQTGTVTFVFKPDYEEWEPNCVIHEEICNKLRNQLFCAIGYFKENKLIASEYVRFTYRMP